MPAVVGNIEKSSIMDCHASSSHKPITMSGCISGLLLVSLALATFSVVCSCIPLRILKVLGLRVHMEVKAVIVSAMPHFSVLDGELIGTWMSISPPGASHL